MSDYY